MWWDYGVKPGDVVQYSVVPVVGPDKDHLKLATASASTLTDAMTITGQSTPKIAAYFNKGIVAAQWVSRARKGRQGRENRYADRHAGQRPAQCLERTVASAKSCKCLPM